MHSYKRVLVKKKKNPNLKLFSVFPSWEKLRWSHCPKNISFVCSSIETGKDATILSRAFKRDTRTSFNPGVILHQGIQKSPFSLLKGKKLKSRISPLIKYHQYSLWDLKSLTCFLWEDLCTSHFLPETTLEMKVTAGKEEETGKEKKKKSYRKNYPLTSEIRQLPCS